MLGLVSKKDLNKAIRETARVYDEEFQKVRTDLANLKARLDAVSFKVGELMDVQDSETNAYEKIAKELANIKRTKVNISALDKAIEKKLEKPKKKVSTKKKKAALGKG